MILVLVCTSWLAFSLAGQNPVINSEQELLHYMNSQQYRDNRDANNIEGSPCVNEEFAEGAVFYNQKKYLNLELRYNNYEGCIEYRDRDGIKYFPPRLFRLDTVWIGNDVYLYVDYREGRTVKQTFMKLLHPGNPEVLSFHEVVLLPAEPDEGYKKARPARFETQAEEIFLRVRGKPAGIFRGSKSIPELFPGHQDELLQFTKKHNLRLKNPEEIIGLVRYYESLN